MSAAESAHPRHHRPASTYLVNRYPRLPNTISAIRNSFGTQRSGFRDPGIISHRKLLSEPSIGLASIQGNQTTEAFVSTVVIGVACVGTVCPGVNSLQDNRFCAGASFREQTERSRPAAETYA